MANNLKVGHYGLVFQGVKLKLNYNLLIGIALLKRILVILSTLLIIILLALLVGLYMAPGIALSFAADWYEEQGENYQLEAEDWKFAPFATQLSLTGVTLTHPNVGKEQTHLNNLTLDINLWAMLQQQIVVRNVILDGLDLGLEAVLTKDSESMTVAGISIPLAGADTQKQPGAVEANTESDSTDEEPWTVQVTNLEIKNQRYQWQLSIDGLETEGELQVKNIQIEGLNTAENSEPKINVALVLESLAVSGEQNLLLNAPLALNAKGKLSNLLIQPQWQGDLSVNGLSLVLDDELSLNLSQLSLNNILADAESQSVERLLVKSLGVDDGKGLTLSIDDVSINEISNAGTQQSFASLQVNHIALNDDPMQLALDQISLENFQHQDLKPQLETLLITQLSVTGKEEQLLNLEQYGFNDLAVDVSSDEFSVTLGNQYYSGLLVNIQRDKDGNLVGLPNEETTVDASQEDAKNSEAKEDSKPLLLALVLAGLIQQAEEVEGAETVASKVHVEDYSITPALKTDINITKVSIGEINSTIKQSDFSLTEKVPFEIHLGIGRYNMIVATGSLGLFERDAVLYPQGNVDVTVRQLDLVPFNGYFIQALGYQLDRGSLDVDAHITFDKAQLGGNVKILLRNSKFTPVNEETISKISKQISMPIDTAVGLLRDDNGNLRLSIPLEGDLADPDVGLNDITKQLTQKALKAGTVYFLKQAMQPYGTMLTVASFAGDYLFAIRLDSLVYEHGVTELTDEQIANLTKVAELMKKKDKLEVKACPFVSTAEADELGEDWSDFALERGQKVKDWLLAYDEKVAARLSICRTQKGEKAEVVLGVN